MTKVSSGSEIVDPLGAAAVQRSYSIESDKGAVGDYTNGRQNAITNRHRTGAGGMLALRGAKERCSGWC